jgi:hypothetical protein
LCEDQNAAVLSVVSSLKVSRLILVANWGWYSQGRAFKASSWPVILSSSQSNKNTVTLEQALLATIASLRQRGIAVAIVGPIPEVGWSPPQVLAMEAWRSVKLASEPMRSEFLAWQSKVIETLSLIESQGGVVVYPHQQLCDEVCRVRRDGAIFYRDSEHMTMAGLLQIRPSLERLFGTH